MGGIKLSTPLYELHGIGPRFLQKFKKLGIETVRDLLWHFPSRYEDFSSVTNISDLVPREECTVRGFVKKLTTRRAWRKRMFIVEGIVEDATGSVRVVWFNQTYIKNILQDGTPVHLSGKVSLSKDGELYFSNPTYEVPSKYGKETKHTARVVPVYPETKGLTSKGLRYIIKPILENIGHIEETLPESIVRSMEFRPLTELIQTIHFPESIEDGISARKRFAFEDLFLLQLFLTKERMRVKKQKARSIPIDIPLIQKFLKTLPFELTDSQKKSLWEIIKDIENKEPMNRLLQGDVGSGKTIIAAIAALSTSKAGFQTAFMAPTEILAQQHYETMRKLFAHEETGIALLTGSEARISYDAHLETTLKKQELVREIEKGSINIVVGTHSLIAGSESKKSVPFRQLGLVVVDEQHRFGIRQRAQIIEPDTNGFAPHFLSMSATPIPRTLSLTLWSDLDLSLITELPKNRKPIITKVIPPEDRARAYAFIRKEVQKGRQVFVVCPRIEPQETDASYSNKEWEMLEIKSVKEEYKKLSEKIFPDLSIAMIHGKMPSKNKSSYDKEPSKQDVMQKFKDGKIDILVSTAVIEVGVDVPNATIMMIEGADRFGLAQLYQFKGRVGRGEHQSYCILFSESSSQDTKKRLLSIVEAKNGFELAEKDLLLRGPGQFVGTEQKGMPDLAMKALKNPEITKEARNAARDILLKDPDLKKNKKTKESLNIFTQKIHRE